MTPAQAREHLHLIDTHLSAPDGVRLFDRPMTYHGGPQRLFQRAETATYFGREIGLMYTHAHLRYAQALAHVGRGRRLLSGAVPGQSHRHRLDRATRHPATGQLLLLELRCRVRGSLSGQRRIRARRAGHDRSRWRLARLFQRRGHLAGPDHPALPGAQPRGRTAAPRPGHPGGARWPAGDHDPGRPSAPDRIPDRGPRLRGQGVGFERHTRCPSRKRPTPIDRVPRSHRWPRCLRSCAGTAIYCA